MMHKTLKTSHILSAAGIFASPALQCPPERKRASYVSAGLGLCPRLGNGSGPGDGSGPRAPMQRHPARRRAGLATHPMPIGKPVPVRHAGAKTLRILTMPASTALPRSRRNPALPLTAQAVS